MTAQSGLGFAGIVAINIPDDGATGEVLTKLTPDNYDYDWAAVGGVAPSDAEYVVISLDPTLTDERVLTAGADIDIVDGGAGGAVTISVTALAFGDVFKVGVPVVMEVGVWTGDGTIEGNDNFQWDTSVTSGRMEIKCVDNVLDEIGIFLIDPDSVLNPAGWQWCTGQGGLFDGTLILSHDPTDVVNNRDVTYLPGGRPTFGFGIAVPPNFNLADENVGALAFFQPRDTTGRNETKVSFVGVVGGTGNEGVFSVEGFAYGDAGLQFHRLAHFIIDADYHLHVEILGDLDMTGYIHPNTATDAELNDITDAINTDIGKIQSAMVYNTTTDNPVYAVGAADGSVWVDGAGTTVNTPV